ncbi:DUF1761 domain-containing protein [Aliifodinibius sp. S!AR15-10]|uniref:DUF1761 domain-containing protein n=1 Tax=Aliifodinibius sp. S!AR15-10 TaxID=2950437 RepID=UPI002856BB28|nr:DUF1761 domain-containing protein [Aliifodinibius sp. S!AR15-10]MDR8391245.1 DUF1761 domain-containing protein [Aliifodinibius sp. S!AR15-10]
MGELLSELNWLAAIVGGIAYFMIGWLWYGPLFGKAWMKEKGIEEHPESPEPIIFLYSLILQTIAAISLGLFIVALGVSSAIEGLYIGLAAGAGFVLTTVGVNGIYNDMSLKLFAIDGGYHLVGFAAAGLIIGLW